MISGVQPPAWQTFFTWLRGYALLVFSFLTGCFSVSPLAWPLFCFRSLRVGVLPGSSPGPLPQRLRPASGLCVMYADDPQATLSAWDSPSLPFFTRASDTLSSAEPKLISGSALPLLNLFCLYRLHLSWCWRHLLFGVDKTPLIWLWLVSLSYSTSSHFRCPVSSISEYIQHLITLHCHCHFPLWHYALAFLIVSWIVHIQHSSQRETKVKVSSCLPFADALPAAPPPPEWGALGRRAPSRRCVSPLLPLGWPVPATLAWTHRALMHTPQGLCTGSSFAC